jgi:hypothetical protein
MLDWEMIGYLLNYICITTDKDFNLGLLIYFFIYLVRIADSQWLRAIFLKIFVN